MKSKQFDYHFYQYVGAKAGGNFITTNNIVTQMLFALCQDKDNVVIKRLVVIFNKIGYDPRVKIKVKLDESKDVTSFEKFKNLVELMAETTKGFNSNSLKKLSKAPQKEKKEIYNVYKFFTKNGEIELDLQDFDDFSQTRQLYAKAYFLRQLKLVSKINYLFIKEGVEIDCNNLSSGETNMLAMIISIASSITNNALVLLDEPELSQHPNWQMSIIDHLYSVFGDFPCHLIIATHSHFLVSDLPMDTSEVIQMDYDENNGLITELITNSTYGWSAEEVLLQVFKTSTDRNMYLGNIIGKLLDKIKEGDINEQEVNNELLFLDKVSQNLKEIDPFKKIIDSLLKAFSIKI